VTVAARDGGLSGQRGRDLQAARGDRDLRRVPVHADGQDPASRPHAPGPLPPAAGVAMTAARPKRIFDVHSHWGTKRGYPFQTPEELAQQERVFRSKPRYVSEAEMAEHFRATGVRAILDLGVRAPAPIDEVRALHDYAFATQAEHADVIVGHWL